MNAKNIELFILDIKEKLQEQIEYEDIKLFINLNFEELRNTVKEKELKKELNQTNLSNYQKRIFLDVYRNGSDLIDFLNLKIKGLTEKEVPEQVKLFEEIIFDKDFIKKINKQSTSEQEKNEYIEAINFLKDEILPNINLEICSKFYIYVASGNFYEDLKHDPELKAVFVNKDNENAKSKILKNINNKLEKWRVDRNHANEMDCCIVQEINHFDDIEETDNIWTKNTKPGYIDAVMKSATDNEYYIARSNFSLPENDPYHHLTNRLHEDKAISVLLDNLKAEGKIYDFSKGHNEKSLLKILENDISKEEIEEVKNVFDKILHKGVSEITGLNPIIIQVGDKKYNIEQEDYLNLSLKITEFIKNNEIDFNHKFLLNLMEKNIEWMTINMLKNINFYEDENFKKVQKYFKNMNQIKRENNIINSKINKELDHLGNKIDNKEKSKNILLINEEKEKLYFKIKSLEKNGIFLYLDENTKEEYKIIRNDILKEFHKDIVACSEGELSIIPEINRKNNKQYKILHEIFSEEYGKDKKIKESLENKVNIGKDPLLKTYYQIRKNIHELDNNLNGDALKNISISFSNINDLYNKKGYIYDYLTTKKQTKDAITYLEDTAVLNKSLKEYNLNKSALKPNVFLRKIDNFSDKLMSKKDIINQILEKEINQLKQQLDTIKKVEIKIEDREDISEDVKKIIKNQRIKKKSNIKL